MRKGKNKSNVPAYQSDNTMFQNLASVAPEKTMINFLNVSKTGTERKMDKNGRI